MTRARKAERVFAYASSDMRLSRAIARAGLAVLSLGPRCVMSSLQSVGNAQKRQRMLLLHAFSGSGLGHALLDRPSCDRTIRADPVRARRRHLLEHRLADLHRRCVMLGLHAPRAIVSGATLDRGDGGLGNPLEHLPGLVPDVLHA